MSRVFRCMLFPALLLLVSSAGAGAPGVGAQADRMLRAMSDYLKTAGEFTFHADISYDSVLTSGEKIQYGGTADISVHRPNRLHVAYRGDEQQRRVFFNGRTITLYDVAANVYAVTEVPSEIDAAVDLIFKKFGFSVPIADLVYADPYATLTENVQAGSLVGRHAVDGTPTYHLAFTQETIDWQIWIEDGPQPIPRKLLITYKNEPGSPQYTARLSGWDFQPRLSDHYFQFQTPAGANEIEFLTTQQRGTKQ